MGGGCFFVKNGKWGVFCKKWTFPQRRVHYVQYQYFILYFTYLGGAYVPNAPPCLRACGEWKMTDWKVRILLNFLCRYPAY